MKIILLLTAMLLSSSVAFSAEPIIKVEPLPSGAELELYEDSEGLFALKLLEYYKAAVALETQLLIMGIEPENRISQPTLDDLQDMEVRTLKRYYSQANGILQQVQKAPDGLYSRKIEEMRLKLEKMYGDNFLLKEQLHTQNLDLISADFYKQKYKELVKQTDSLRLYIDSSYYNYMTKLWEHDNNMRSIYENCTDCMPILSVSSAGNFWDFGNERISTDISPSVMVNFNPSPIIGFGRLIDIWGEYSYPIIETIANPNTHNERVSEHKTDIFTTGLNLNVPLSEIMKIDDFYLGFKAGYGFFWGDTRMPNTDMPSAKWQGQMLRLEINAANYNKFFFPVGVFVSYNFYNFSKELRFPSFGEQINLGKPWINNLQLGIKFSLWRSSSLVQK